MPTIPIPIPVPVPASVLVDRELARRKKLRREQRKGNILTGCKEIDEYVLLGGFERGSVVGMTSEDDEMGLLIGLQTVAHLLATATIEMIRNQNDTGKGKTTTFSYPRVTIVTMFPVNVLVPKLRQVLVNQLVAGLPAAAAGGGLQNINALVKQCLRSISISMVFDVEGLREVLGEIGASNSVVEAEEQEQRHVQQDQEQEQEQEQEQNQEQLAPQDGPTSKEDPVEAETEAVQSEPVVSIPIRSPAKPQPVKSRFKTEILDSEDEGEDEDGVEVEDLGNTTDMSSELSSPPASLPDEFEEYEKLLEDNTPPKPDEDIPETTTESSINNNDDQTQPQTDNIENQAGEGGDNPGNTDQTQPPPENKDSEPSLDIEAQPPPPPPEAENRKPPTNIVVQPSPPSTPPDMILITHMSALLNGLFTGRDKSTAHETVTLLSSQLRQLTSRLDDCPPPLIMILNSTTASSSSMSVAMTGENNPNNLGEPPTTREREQHQQTIATDPTLRSIFQHHHQSGSKTKPSFGTVFTQLLDLHLLCTRIPRRQRQTGPAARGGMGRGEPPLSTARARVGVGEISSPSHRFAWIVEVLLDERGFYEYGDVVGVDDGIAGEERSPPEAQIRIQIRRRCREQRWGAVEVEEGGGRIIDVVV